MNSAYRFTVSAAAAAEKCVQNGPGAFNTKRRKGSIYSPACRRLGGAASDFGKKNG